MKEKQLQLDSLAELLADAENAEINHAARGRHYRSADLADILYRLIMIVNKITNEAAGPGS